MTDVSVGSDTRAVHQMKIHICANIASVPYPLATPDDPQETVKDRVRLDAVAGPWPGRYSPF